MNELLDMGKKVLDSQPFSRLLDAELTAFEVGAAELVLAVREELKQQHGFVHGGVLSYLADNSLTYVGGSVLGDCVTSEFIINQSLLNYLKPALGDILIARAGLIAGGKRQAVCECKIYAVANDNESKEVLVAAAQGTITKIEPR